MPMIHRTAVRAIVLQDNKLLCVKQRPYNDISQGMNEHWNLPGGGLDEGESLLRCLQREMLEETGIPAVPGNLMFIQQFSYKDTEYLEFFFHVTNAADYTHIDLSKTTHGEQEIAEIGFVDPQTTKILPLFLSKVDLRQQTTKPTAVYSI